MRSIMRTVALRLSEPSSWAGIGAILAASGYALPSQFAQYASMTLAGIFGLVAFFLPEKEAAER
jgi:hypothetical protein